MSEERRDIEMALMRILATDGLLLGGISDEDRRERIRLAIVQRGLKDQVWPLDADLTYGEAFAHCYKRQVEMRRRQRDANHRPLPPLERLRDGPGDDDDAGDEDDDEGITSPQRLQRRDPSR
jgi:hypothetical protein